MPQPSPAGVVVYGSMLWDQPWLTEHNLAYSLSKRHPVLFVEPPMTPLTPFRSGRPFVEDVRHLLGHRLRTNGNMSVLAPLALPPAQHPRAKRASVPLLRRQVAWAAGRLGFHEPAAIAARPIGGLAGAAGERDTTYIVKDLIEAGADLLGRREGDLVDEHRDMLARADRVLAISPRLRDTLAEQGWDAELLRHGFDGELAAAYDAAAPPPEYADLPRPLLGYTGRTDGRIDFELLGKLADRFPSGSLVFVGPVSALCPDDFDRLLERPNVHALGSRRREELPAYVKHLDCLLLPYRDDDWVRHQSPLKVWDYLYAGSPIVGAACQALLDFPPPLVHFAPNADAFVTLVERALDQPLAGRDERRAFALENTWDMRAAQLERSLPGLAA